MSILSNVSSIRIQSSDVRSAKAPFWLQVTTMTWRTLVTTFRTPAAVIPGVLISGFFLLVYNASLGNASNFLPGLVGKSYLAFILPVSIVSSALSGAGAAGQAIVRDIESGYFDKLLLTPISRGALLLGTIIAGAIILGLQTAVVMFIGLLMGLQPETGLAGVVAVMGLALLLGTGFSGFTVGIALRTGNAAATQGGSFLFFPLTFLTATFVPVSLLSGWIKTAAAVNPITYLLEAMRSLLMNGWEGDVLVKGLLACLILGVLMFAFALSGLRARTARR
jgi:ABC-2 type transport system permease protein